MNKIKLVFLVLIISLTTKTTFGQISFSHAVGISIFRLIPAITYSPRLNLVQLNKETNLSLGTHLAYGFRPYKDASGPIKNQGSFFVYEVPLVAEINFGCGSSPQSNSNIGGFFGIGYAVNKTSRSPLPSSYYNEASGIYFNAGVRTITKRNYLRLGLRLSYLKNFKTDYHDELGFGIFYRL